MATLLLIVIYIAFIGLGIPDSLFGTAWPAIYKEFSLSISDAGYVTLLISGFTMLSSVFCTRIINRFGTCFVTAVSTVLTAVALFGFSISHNIYLLCLFAIPLGLGAGAVDAALNNYVALHYSASHMSFLHCFYGIGVTVSPYLMSLALSDGQWRAGYRMAFYIQAVIAIITILSVPLWKRAEENTLEEDVVKPKTVSLIQLAKMRKVRLAWIVFIMSCTVEYTLGTWSSTFLVETRGVLPENAARAVMLYYAGMATGRFLSGVAASRLSCGKIIRISESILVCAVLLLFIPCGELVSAIVLFAAGVGIGPIFPNMMHITPNKFGKEISQSVIGSMMAASYLGIMLMPPLFGVLANIIGIWFLPVFLTAVLLIMLFADMVLSKSKA